jgi:hypothetical protein
MKRVFLAFVSFFSIAGVYAQTDGSNKGNLVSREVNVGNFSAINLNGVMNVYLSKGDKVAVRVEADEKVQDKITVEVTGNTLSVKTKKGNWSNVKKMNVYITFTSISELKNNLVGNLTGESIITEDKFFYKSGAVGNTHLQLDVKDLQLDIAAVGNSEISGKAINCELENSSVGNVRAGKLLVENMDLKSSAVGNLEYNAKNTITLKSNGVGKVINKGGKEIR